MTDAAHKAWARRMAEEDLMYAVLYPRCRHRVPTAVADAIDVLDVAATIPHHVADADVARAIATFDDYRASVRVRARRRAAAATAGGGGADVEVTHPK